MAQKFRLGDPLLNEFMYDCIVSSSEEQRAKLPEHLRKTLLTKVKIKSFVDNASLERKIEMLSRLGINCALFFSPKELKIKEQLNETRTAVEQKTRKNQLKHMVRSKVFVTTSREIMALLGVMAQNCHSETYMLNREYARLATAIAKLYKYNPQGSRDIEEVRSIQQDYNLVLKLVLYTLNTQQFVEGFTGYLTVDLRILFYLYMRKNEFVHLSAIADYFKGITSASLASAALNRLRRSNHIERFPGRYEYCIAPKGITVVSAYISRLMNNTMNF